MALAAEQTYNGGEEGSELEYPFGPLFIGGLWEHGAWDLGGINSHWFGDVGVGVGLLFPGRE